MEWEVNLSGGGGGGLKHKSSLKRVVSSQRGNGAAP